MKLPLPISQIKRAKIICLLIVYCLLPTVYSFGQDSTKAAPEPVTSTFRGPQLINMPTNEIIDGLGMNIQHRFGQIVNTYILYDFFGMDLSANIRLALAYPIIKDRLQVEIGRTKSGKNVDMEIKYQVLRQTEKNEIPVSVALYANSSVSTEKFPKVPAYAFYTDSVTPFEYKFSHRLNYNYQLVIARKFTKKFSFQVAPVLVYKTLAVPGKDNQTIALQSGGRYKFSKKGAVLMEYGYAFNNRDTATINPLSLAVEFSTAGHVFQIVLSSTNHLLYKDIYTTQNADYSKGEFYLGFNIRRFW